MNSVSRAATFWVVALTASAYAGVGWLAVQMALPPSYAAPLYPSAGIALAAAVVWGRPALLGVGLGAFAVNLGLSAGRGQPALSATLIPLLIGIGAALQAGLGAWLARRFVQQPLTLDKARDVLKFLLLCAVLACALNASLASAALWASGVLTLQELPLTWAAWWIGDSLGALIAAPIVLSLVGSPRSHWVPRRLSLALPLLLATSALLTASWLVNRWEGQRQRAAFEREASNAAQAMSDWMQGPLQALQALHGLFLANAAIDPDGVRRATTWWLGQGLHLQAVGFGEWVPRAHLPAFEAKVRAAGQADFRVFDIVDAAAAAVDHGEVLAVRFIEPRQRDASARGLNALSVAASGDAIARTRRTGQPSAALALPLAGEQRGLAFYQAVFEQGQAPATRAGRLLGVAFVVVDIDAALLERVGRFGSDVHWCLLDSRATGDRRVAGAPGCDSAPRLAYAYERVLPVADQHWLLRLDSPSAPIVSISHTHVWLFAVLGLLLASIGGALLLITTGRARRIEQLVNERTIELRHEVGERQRTEDALRASEQQLQAILDSARVGIVKTDIHGRILMANPAYCRLLRYSEAELRERTVGEITHADDIAEENSLRQAIEHGDSDFYRREKRFMASDGTVVHVQLTVALLRDAAGRPEFTVGVVEDIGEHLQLAEAQRARESAESSNRAKSEFVSRMSHELRTPLNAMLGFAQLLGLDRKPQLAEHQRAWTTQIQQAGWHLLHMINDTLDLSRIESGMLKLEPVALEVAPLVRSAMAIVESAASKRALHMEEKFDRRARAVLGDETRIKQILTNLLSNAVKYNVDGGHIQVRVRSGEAQAVEIVVSDTGLGMTRAQTDGLFQPYNRLGREHSAVEGTGIGLVISRRLAELMGGSLRAHSVAGEGSTFILSLPRATFADTDISTGGNLATPPAEYRHRLVHYIEDNETNIEVMRGMLMRRPQVRLGVSMNGLDGLAAVRQQRPSLILLDMHLPDIDGLELLRHLKNDDDLCNVPVVVVSADATPTHIEQALTAGAAHYVTKPVNLSAFLSIIDELLDDLDTHYG